MLHQHSTLCGIAATVALILAVGQSFHWLPAPMIVTGLLGVLILPRVFYGLAASRALDKEPYSKPAGGGWLRNWYPAPTEEERLENAIQAAEGFGPGVGPDPSALERLAEEETPRTKD